MKAADAFMASWITLTHAMQTDTRFTVDERAALTALNTRLDAAGVSTKEDDMLVVDCMKKFCSQNENYTTW